MDEEHDASFESICKELKDKTRNTVSVQGIIPWEILLQCLQQKSNIEAVALMKKFGGLLKKLDISSTQRDNTESDLILCIEILTQIFVTVEPKGALCRMTASILQGLPVYLHQLVISTLKESLTCQLNSNTEQEIQYVVCKVHLIGACMENFPRGEECLDTCLEMVLDFLTKVLQKFHHSARSSCSAAGQTELMKNCLATIKITMAVIQKFFLSITEELKNENSSCKGSIEAFMELSWSILSNEMFVADCRSAAGMAVPLVLKILASKDTLPVQIFKILTTEKNLPPEDGITWEVDTGQGMSCNKFSKDYAKLVPSSQLFLCHGALAMLSSKDLLQSVDVRGSCLLVDVIFPLVYQLTERLSDSSSTLAAARTLTLWTTVGLAAITKQPEDAHLKNAIVGSACIPQKLIQYVWTNWDHPIDGMRHQTRMIFENILGIHQQASSTEPSSDPFLLNLLHNIISVSWHVRGKYGPLGCLVQHLGTAWILRLYPTMHHTVLDMLMEQTIVPYACDLMAKLFTSHLRELVASSSSQGEQEGLSMWQNTWVLPALEILCNPAKSKQHKSFLVEYYLPKLLKFSPESLTYIVNHLQQHNQSTPIKVNSDQLGALLTCLKTSRALGLIKAGNKDDNQEEMWKGLVSISVLKQALCHQDPQVQLNALGLLCDSNKTTEQFSLVELELLSTFLSLNMTNSSPAFRQQMCSHIKKMLIRLRESGRLLSKYNSSKKCSSEDDDTSNEASLMSVYKNFVAWFCEFQFTNLEPGARYPRRATALHILSMVIQIFNSPNKQGKHQTLFNTQDIWTPSHVQLLMMRLTDNYESNKVMAFDLLNELSQETLGLLDKTHLDSMYNCSLELACSNKPHYCESASYILRVLSRQLRQPVKMAATSQEQCIMGILQDLCGLLQSQVSIAKESLLEASVQGPMYGILHCIREVSCDVNYNSVSESSDWRDMLQTIIKLCFDVAEVASTVVCNSSPEGYLPDDDSNDVETDDDKDSPLSKSTQVQDLSNSSRSDEVTTLQVTPQMVLVCCWRSMKEVSLLLGQLALDVPVCEARDESTSSKSLGLINEKQVVEIGELFLQLLKESKHRGAFELAYVGFVKLCTKLWRSKTRSLHQLPEQWLEGLMGDVTSDQPMLCATRRSAGIPFAIQALLNSEPASFNKQHFKSVMSRLLNLALLDGTGNQTSSTSQVHALNILRALYRDTHHGEDVFPYVADGVRAAILGFQAKLWAVRNSATMLFSALITRIFGVKRGKEEQSRRNCMTGREFFSRFPALHGFLLIQLTEAAEKIDSSAKAHLHPALFPVLLLLSRLYPSAMDGSDSSLSMAVFVPHILRCAGSAVFKTRCIAARALVAVVPRGNVPKMLKQLIETLPQNSQMMGSEAVGVSHNYIHGILLQIQSLLETHLQDSNISSSCEMQTSIASVLPQLGNSMWLATRNNHCFVTRSTMLTILNTFILDQSWISPTNSCQQQAQESFQEVKLALHSIIKSGTTTNTSDARDRQQPGFTEWQTAHAQMCLKMVRDEDFLENMMDHILLSSDKSVDDIFLSQTLSKSCEISDSQHPPNIPTGEFKDRTSLSNSDSCDRTELDKVHRQRKPDVGEEVINIVLDLLSSPNYEVQELVLTELLTDQTSPHTCTSHGESTGIGRPNMWSKVNQSHEIFNVLVTMVIGEGRDAHPACIEKALLLLSHHPLSLIFPWHLLGGNHLSCIDCFNKILEVASLDNQRDEIVCAAIQLTTSLIPVLCHNIKEEKDKGISEALQDWTNLLECYSQAEQSNQSRTVVANTLGKLADTVLIDPNHIFGVQVSLQLWGIVMRLLQDDDTQVQNAASRCIKQTVASLPTSISESCPQTDIQSALALEVGLAVMTNLYAKSSPNQYIQTLVSWLTGALEGEECIMGTPVHDGNDQAPEDRLFDRGEANTNYERLLFGKAVLRELQTIAMATDCTGDAATIPDTDPCQSASNTTRLKEIESGRAYCIEDRSLSRKAVEFDSGSGCNNPRAHNAGGVRPVVLDGLTAANRHGLVTTAHRMTSKILVALEIFLKNTSDVSITTPYLDTTGYEMNCVKCWCLLASLLGLGVFPNSEGNNCDNKVRQLQIMQLVIDKFGGTRHCNPLILKVVNEIKKL